MASDVLIMPHTRRFRVEDDDVPAVAFGEQRQQRFEPAVGVSRCEGFRHDLSGDFRFAGMGRWRSFQQLRQTSCGEKGSSPVAARAKSPGREQAMDALAAVDDRQGLDVVLPHQPPGVIQMGAEMHHVRGFAHDVGAGRQARHAAVGFQLGDPQQAIEIPGGDIENFVVFGQGGGEIGFGEAHQSGTAGRRRGGDVRIAVAGQRMVGDAEKHHQGRVCEGGKQHEKRAVRMGEDHEQGHGAPRRVQAAQGEHGRDGSTDRQTGGGDRIGNKIIGQQTYDGPTPYCRRSPARAGPAGWTARRRPARRWRQGARSAMATGRTPEPQAG